MSTFLLRLQPLSWYLPPTLASTIQSSSLTSFNCNSSSTRSGTFLLCLNSTSNLLTQSSSLSSLNSLSTWSGTFLPYLSSTSNLLTQSSSSVISNNSKLFQLATVASNNFPLRAAVAQSNKSSSSRLAKLVLVNQDGTPHPAQVFYDWNTNLDWWKHHISTLSFVIPRNWRKQERRLGEIKAVLLEEKLGCLARKTLFPEMTLSFLSRLTLLLEKEMGCLKSRRLVAGSTRLWRRAPLSTW